MKSPGIVCFSALAAKKPVIVSMSDVAASGGYYIAAGATKIFALEDTLTGSIGVVGGKVAIGQGRVWTGRQAKEIGLVDELGGLERAVALAKQRAKIAQDAEVELLIYPPKKTFFEMMADPLGSSGTARLASMLGIANPKVIQTLAAPLQVFRRGEPLALMPNVFVR